MLSIVASLIAVCVATLVATNAVLRWWRRDLLQQLADLRNELTATRHEMESLKALLDNSRTTSPVRQRRDFLEQIEQLGDSAALADDGAIEQVARDAAQLPTDIAADLFTADHKLLDITRLIDNGHSLSEIARRLRLPLGEVELLSSLRTSE